MEDIFCRIIKGEIPSTKIYEDDDVLAILDISQTTKGHTLVIPKAHCDNFLSCPADIMHKVMDVAQRIGQAEMSILGAKGVNILTNVGEPAGQSVMHFHVHVIPRYLGGEGGFQITMKGQDTSGMDLPRLAMDISKALKK
ncbi:MAG: HIT family protein [Candidatus Enteromonas sp.]|jgi:histidine triad (HIT) family protein|nr:HIT family protein [Bacilli bacterium]MEE3401487.1 HIT family protein [Candidatus Enteromonas sp.]MBQ4182826.1 HIT family protein [Bacilli bacterium]MEE3426347.1 HIT family protein [Candidatus Enteromonas sp.]MEE3431476.1 HIT family protein [Candidatus Enteromonas sp.]